MSWSCPNCGGWARAKRRAPGAEQGSARGRWGGRSGTFTGGAPWLTGRSSAARLGERCGAVSQRRDLFGCLDLPRSMDLRIGCGSASAAKPPDDVSLAGPCRVAPTNRPCGIEERARLRPNEIASLPIPPAFQPKTSRHCRALSPKPTGERHEPFAETRFGCPSG